MHTLSHTHTYQHKTRYLQKPLGPVHISTQNNPVLTKTVGSCTHINTKQPDTYRKRWVLYCMSYYVKPKQPGTYRKRWVLYAYEHTKTPIIYRIENGSCTHINTHQTITYRKRWVLYTYQHTPNDYLQKTLGPVHISTQTKRLLTENVLPRASLSLSSPLLSELDCFLQS